VAGKVFEWLDHRTGYRKFLDMMLLEHIPGGAKWRYVWGSCLAFVFMVQLITGVLLMTAYSPGDSTAWGSVYFIQYEMDFGWLIRGLHHFGSQTMVVLMGLHMLQVVIAGAHLPPREINWWLGLGLLGVVFGLSLTGYLLPWDQKGFWATQVATNIAGSLPVIGPEIQRIIIGGPVYGNHTLTHFYALHVGILPPLLIVLMIAHIAVFRRHGVTYPPNAQGEGMFWPDQAFRDLVVSLIIFGIMLSLVIFSGHGNALDNPPVAKDGEPSLYEQIAKAGQYGYGANLDAPADPITESYPARPEWYFLFLFQLLKYFEGDQEIIGTVVIPNGVMVLLFILPLLGFGAMRKFGHFFGIFVVVALLLGVGLMTFLAIADDNADQEWAQSSAGMLWGDNLEKKAAAAKGLRKEFEVAHHAAKRAVNLASDGIPDTGARDLLRKDPLTRGRRLFEVNCVVCHAYSADPEFAKLTGPFKAADLGGFASEKWIRGLLDNPGSDKYFGLTGLAGMRDWRKKVDETRVEWKTTDEATYKEKVAEQEKKFDTIAKWLAQQSRPADERDKKLDEEGLKAFDARGPGKCSACHTVDGSGSTAPDFQDYGSAAWLRLMIMSPAHELRHVEKNEMPAFRDLDRPGAEVHAREFKSLFADTPIINLSEIDRELIIRFLTQDHRVVFGGEAISAAPKRSAAAVSGH